nr:hypothetical protein GCM10020093_017870 [Planobispora longispora]
MVGPHPEEADAVRRGLAGFFAGLPENLFADAVGTLQRAGRRTRCAERRYARARPRRPRS